MSEQNGENTRERVSALEARDGERREQFIRLDNHIRELTSANAELAKQVGVLAHQVQNLSGLPSQVEENTQSEAVQQALAVERQRAARILREHIGLIVTITTGLSGLIFAAFTVVFGG